MWGLFEYMICYIDICDVMVIKWLIREDSIKDVDVLDKIVIYVE